MRFAKVENGTVTNIVEGEEAQIMQHAAKTQQMWLECDRAVGKGWRHTGRKFLPPEVQERYRTLVTAAEFVYQFTPEEWAAIQKRAEKSAEVRQHLDAIKLEGFADLSSARIVDLLEKLDIEQERAVEIGRGLKIG